MLIEYVEKLQSLDVIERIHNTEGWLNQILFVRKPDQSWRPCLDCRRTINDLARPLVSSLPHVQDCVDALAGAQFITVQDAKSAYWQLELHPNDRKYTSFATPSGNFCVQARRDGLDLVATGVDKRNGYGVGKPAMGVDHRL